MVKILCDRCGKEIPASGWTGYLAWNFRNGYKGDLVHDNMLENRDYCEDCMGEILDFISGGGKEETGEGGTCPTVWKEGAGPLEAGAAGNGSRVKKKPGGQQGKTGKKAIDAGKIIALKKAGRSVRWIADDMGISQQSVYNALNRAREQDWGDADAEPDH